MPRGLERKEEEGVWRIGGNREDDSDSDMTGRGPTRMKFHSRPPPSIKGRTDGGGPEFNTGRRYKRRDLGHPDLLIH
jgi:hypothetical protein